LSTVESRRHTISQMRSFAAAQNMRVIDYDNIEEWSPWFTILVATVAPAGLLETLRRSNPEHTEYARDHVVAAIGRQQLVEHLNRELKTYAVRVFHGTRLTGAEVEQVRVQGLRALKLVDRRQQLLTIFTQHPDWSAAKDELLDAQLRRFGPDWERGGAGRREDDSVHVCLSRSGLLLGCNHYLTHGAEVDQHIAQALFPGDSGLDLLKRNRVARLVSFTAPFAEAAQAANPYAVVASHELPALLSLLVGAWAYKTAKPRFSVAKERSSAALKFKAPITPERLAIEDIDDAELMAVEPSE
jgi:hypothetical protein